MQTRLRQVVIAMAMCWLLVPGAAADKVAIPPLEKIIVQSWVGISQQSPYGVYRLTVKEDGTGSLVVHEGVPRRWQIERWQLKGSHVYFTLAPNKEVAGVFAIHGEIPVGGEALTLRTRLNNQADVTTFSL